MTTQQLWTELSMYLPGRTIRE